MQNNKTIRKASLDDLKQIYLIEKDVFSNEHWTLEMVESEYHLLEMIDSSN